MQPWQRTLAKQLTTTQVPVSAVRARSPREHNCAMTLFSTVKVTARVQGIKGVSCVYCCDASLLTARKDPKEIWDESEVQDVVEDDIDDGREQPQYVYTHTHKHTHAHV